MLKEKMDEEYSPYLKVLGDLKLLMKKKMLEDKMKKPEKKIEPPKQNKNPQPVDTTDEDLEKDKNYIKDYMQNKQLRKDSGARLLVSVSSEKSQTKNIQKRNKKKTKA